MYIAHGCSRHSRRHLIHHHIIGATIISSIEALAISVEIRDIKLRHTAAHIGQVSHAGNGHRGGIAEINAGGIVPIEA